MRTATRTILTRISFGERLICWECRLDGVWSFVKRYRSTGRCLRPVTSCRNHRRWPAAESESPLRCEGVVRRVDRDDTRGKSERRSEPPKPALFESFAIDLTCWSQVAAHARDLSSHTGWRSFCVLAKLRGCVWAMESKCLLAFRGAIFRPVTFPRGSPSSQACPRPSVGADLG